MELHFDYQKLESNTGINYDLKFIVIWEKVIMMFIIACWWIFWTECDWVNIPVAVLAFRRFLAWLGFWLGAGRTTWPGSLRMVFWCLWYCWRRIWGVGVQQASWRHHASWWLDQAWLQRGGKLPLLMQNVIALIHQLILLKQFHWWITCISIFVYIDLHRCSTTPVFQLFYLNLLWTQNLR